MPGGDRSGPMGGEPMTGWGRGFCGGPEAERFERGGFGGRGRGYGRGGGGWGLRNRFQATGMPGSMRPDPAARTLADTEPTEETELQWLTRRSAVIEAEKEQIKARLNELEVERDD